MTRTASRSVWLLSLLVVGCAEGMGHPRTRGGTDSGERVLDDAAAPGLFDAAREDSQDNGPRLYDGGPDGTCVPEVCGNGLDDDCSGQIDDGCECAPGDMSACYPGAPRERHVGACSDGHMVCEGNEFGVWASCEGAVLPAVEVCDAAGLDEDCDGASNEGCDCVDDSVLSCGSDTGECVAGTQRCTGGTWTACQGAVGAGTETCDGRDEDCDGSIDEGLTRGCGTDVGVCSMGTSTCRAGTWSACEGARSATSETCDGADEDCDGATDEQVRRACGSDVGACVAGSQVCTAGVFGACSGEVGAAAETCNGQDDDCDGRTDETLTRGCGSDVGACQAGTETCSGGSWSACSGSVSPAAERCEGRNDEDCDGAVDEHCTCTSGSSRACGSTVGRCRAGTQTCSADGNWGACMGATDPRVETCDGTDDDCDGVRDEGCECLTGVSRSCGSNVGECSAGTETCDGSGHWGVCSGGVSANTETCNGRDDDCDGATDESGICPLFPPAVMCPAGSSVVEGTRVPLSASASDPDGGAVRGEWSVVTRPTGSSASTSSSTGLSTAFTPDAAGTYTVRFCAVDDEGDRTCCTTSITASSACEPPAMPTATSCPVSWDRRPVVEFPALPSGLVYELYNGSSTSPYATVTQVGQNYLRPPAALASGGAAPGASTRLSVRACRAEDRTCCSPATSLNVSLVQACTTPVPASSSNIVISEYVVDGDGACPGQSCEAGEALEITNLSNCPVTLDGTHFSYCNGTCASGAYRWMNFGPDDVIPPRGVYVAIRQHENSMCDYAFFGADNPGLFGLRVSRLEMEGPNLISGWFNNASGSMSQLRIASGEWLSPTEGQTLERVSPYLVGAPMCGSVGYDAVDACGELTGVSSPTTTLQTNQLGRLWHPCDAVVNPVPASCR
jgi:Putative metal-binding motif